MKLSKKKITLFCVLGIAALLGIVDEGNFYYNQYRAFIKELEIQKISDSEFENLFSSRSDVQAFIEKFPNYTITHKRTYATKMIIYEHSDDIKQSLLLVTYGFDNTLYQCTKDDITTAFEATADKILRSEC